MFKLFKFYSFDQINELNYILESQNLIRKCLSPSPERRPQLEEILEHPWLKCLTKKFSRKETSGESVKSESFYRSWRKPFHAILHRRSIKRRRRRDADVATGNITDFSDDSDIDKDNLRNLITSSEEECSYRQTTNKVLNNLDLMQCQTAAPITVPQRVLDAIAVSTALSSKADSTIASFSSSTATSTTHQVNLFVIIFQVVQFGKFFLGNTKYYVLL